MRAPVLLTLFVMAVPAAPAAGEVRGVVRYRHAPPAAAPLPVTKDRAVCGESARDESLLVSQGGLANVVVRVVVPGARAEPHRVALDQRSCRYVPHVMAAPAGSTVDLLNGDPILHAVHGWVGAATAFDVPMATQGERRSRLLARPGVIRVGCDIHGWMSAWIVVVDGPHFAVSDAAGRFSIPDVPPGTYAAVAWHERLGERVGSVTVTAGERRATLELVYP